MDTYSMHAGYTVPGVVTGKPISLGGSEGRNEATARGAVFCIDEAARHLGMDLKQATVVVQGFGNAGAHRRAADGGGGREGPRRLRLDGRDPQPGRARHQARHDLEGGARHGRRASPAPRTSPTRRCSRSTCDVLIPAALENQITAANAARIKAKIVAEAANGPTTPEADEILIAAASSSSPTSCATRAASRSPTSSGSRTSTATTGARRSSTQKLHEIMVRAFGETLAIAEREQVHMRMAAYLLAVERVADATALRGLYP